ncbi:MAG: redoxin domain-containing protein [Bacteroidales bacterium]|nr:redoxin domain-containing protein [Bacteroidales bacterium]
MVKRAVITAFALFCIYVLNSPAAQAQTNYYNSVTEYLNAVCTLPVDSIIVRCDKLIASGQTVDAQGNIAGVIFDYFTSCPIMGTEAVSVYIADNYFLNKKLPWPNEETYPSLYTYAEFNRESLIGRSTPELIATDLDGESVNVRNIFSDYKILYFYDSHCATCQIQTPQLVSFLKEYDGECNVTFIAFYTQGEYDEWNKYVATSFATVNNPKVRIVNLWDPEAESAFHRKYSVLTTPALFLIDQDNRIAGRKLDCNALRQLLGQKDSYFASLHLFLNSLLGEMENPDRESVNYVADAFYERTVADPDTFRETMYYIYNYLKSADNYACQQGAVDLAEKYILGMPSMWSGEMLDQTAEAVRLFSLNPLGETANNATLFTQCGFRITLHSVKAQYTILFFNLVSCADCRQYEQAIAGMTSLIKENKAKVVSVYVGPDKDEWKQHNKSLPKKWIKLRASGFGDKIYTLYDISTVPRIYILDKEKRVIAKDITPDTLRLFLENNGF